jgi:isoleucyl-tRNA synthetase
LLVLWNVYAFFVRYAPLAGWTPADPAPAPAERPPLERWILSRCAAAAADVGERLADYDAAAAVRHLDALVEDLSTWYLRLSRRRFSRNADARDRSAAFATLHRALLTTARTAAPILPFMTEAMYGNLVGSGDASAPHSVHLTGWPGAELNGDRDPRLERSMDVVRRAVELARTLRSSAGLRTRQPLARLWLAVPPTDGAELDELLPLIAEEVNVRAVERIDDDAELVERRVKPLLPKIGRRLGPAIPAIMAAARDGRVEIHADGSVTLGGVTLPADEVEIQATPRPGTAVAADDGLVVVIDTALTPELLAEGDARELGRAIQQLRRAAGLELDDRIELWVDGLAEAVLGHLAEVGEDTLAASTTAGPAPATPDVTRATVRLSAGEARIGLRRTGKLA